MWDRVTVLLYPLIKYLVKPALQFALNLLFGPWKQHTDNNFFPCYDVLLNFQLNIAWVNGIEWFLLKFSKMVDISVIEEEDVHLYDITLKEFHFARVKNGVDLSDIDKYPITLFASQDHAAEVIIIPREPVYKYLKKKPDRDGSNITIIHSIGRCGSTLIASMVHRTKQCQVLSEPHPLLRFSGMTNRPSDKIPLDSAKNLKLLKAIMILLCKDPGRLYCIKPTGIYTGNLVHLVHKILPRAKELFLYRALRPTISSYKRVFGEVNMSMLTSQGAKELQSIKYRRIFYKIDAAKLNALQQWIFTLLCQMQPFYLECNDRKNLKSYSYESLLHDRERFCRSLLLNIGIEEQYVSTALTAMEKDSQENSVLSRSKIGGNSDTVPEEVRQWARTVALDEFGIELEGKDCTVSNMQWRNDRPC